MPQNIRTAREKKQCAHCTDNGDCNRYRVWTQKMINSFDTVFTNHGKQNQFLTEVTHIKIGTMKFDLFRNTNLVKDSQS